MTNLLIIGGGDYFIEIINYLKANKEIKEPKRGRLIPAQ